MRVEEAEALLGETLSLLGKIAEHGTWDLPLHMVELDRADEYLGPSEKLAGHLWLAAGRTSASGDLIGGSEIYGRIGARFGQYFGVEGEVSGGVKNDKVNVGGTDVKVKLTGEAAQRVDVPLKLGKPGKVEVSASIVDAKGAEIFVDARKGEIPPPLALSPP